MNILTFECEQNDSFNEGNFNKIDFLNRIKLFEQDKMTKCYMINGNYSSNKFNSLCKGD